MGDDGTNIKVDVALPKFLDSAQVDADVQPTYVRVQAKKNTLQLLLPAEVLTDSSSAQRSTTTGHLLLTCPKIHPIVTARAPEKVSSKNPPRVALREPNATLKQVNASNASPGDSLKGPVDIRHIVPASGVRDSAALESAEPAYSPLGPDWDDEDDVPPL